MVCLVVWQWLTVAAVEAGGMTFLVVFLVVVAVAVVVVVRRPVQSLRFSIQLYTPSQSLEEDPR
jgi:hypothetical protein